MSAAGPPQAVRLIGGRWRRSVLPVADAPGLRPTPARLRETLFNWLGQDLQGWQVLDAFAGSGALGLESASRGAARVTMLERDRRLSHVLQSQVQRLGGEACVQVIAAEALAWMRQAPPQSFDLVLLDPPFDAGLHAPALAAAWPLLRPGGFLYLESPQPWTELPAGAIDHRQARAGAVHARLLQCSS